jgi:signal transduction histidine kinase
MRRLYQEIYLTILASLLVVVLVAGAFWRFGTDNPPIAQALELATEIARTPLPPADAPSAVQHEAVERIARRFGADLGLFDRALRPLAAFGRPVPPPSLRNEDGGWVFGPGGPAFSFRLPDQRWVVARVPAGPRHPVLRLMLFLGTIGLVVAGCAYPVVRGITRRLERLQAGVETLGAGNLSARVKVEGRDEVARLAASFNRAAERIEELVGAHRMLLANASHELRTPLSRIQLALELYQQNPEEKYKAALKQDIGELDLLIDEILLASRLDAIRTPQATEEVDLLALLAEEGARYDCAVHGEPIAIRGDPRLLRRMMRNLMENAQRHGQPPVTAELRREGAHAVLSVIDAGPGVPASHREHVFMPFHRLGGETRGAGLGLSLVRQIARLHGGDAVVAPRTDKPSCFRVTLPLAGSA